MSSGDGKNDNVFESTSSKPIAESNGFNNIEMLSYFYYI